MAERGGFEPPVRQDRTTAFEAAAFNHSATSPQKESAVVAQLLGRKIIPKLGA